eukprot:939068_1
MSDEAVPIGRDSHWPPLALQLPTLDDTDDALAPLGRTSMGSHRPPPRAAAQPGDSFPGVVRGEGRVRIICARCKPGGPRHWRRRYPSGATTIVPSSRQATTPDTGPSRRPTADGPAVRPHRRSRIHASFTAASPPSVEIRRSARAPVATAVGRLPHW